MESLSNWPGSVVDRCPQLPWAALIPLLSVAVSPRGGALLCSPPSKGPSLLTMSSWPAQAAHTGHAQ